MQGTSGSYAINGVDLALQPTEGQWSPRESFGISGDGHLIYSGVRSFEMRFQLTSMQDFNQFLGFYNTVSVTGTVVVDLPSFTDGQYVYKSYSGCSLREPEMGAFFAEHPQEVKLIVFGIKT